MPVYLKRLRQIYNISVEKLAFLTGEHVNRLELAEEHMVRLKKRTVVILKLLYSIAPVYTTTKRVLFEIGVLQRQICLYVFQRIQFVYYELTKRSIKGQLCLPLETISLFSLTSQLLRALLLRLAFYSLLSLHFYQYLIRLL